MRLANAFLAAVATCAVVGAAQADVIVGPTLDNNIGGWADSGLQFTALQNVFLTDVTFNNQGLADTVTIFNQTTNTVVDTIAVGSGNGGAFVISGSWALNAGDDYIITNTGPSNGRWTSYTSWPTSNAHLQVNGTWGSDRLQTSWWFTYTHLTTDPVPAPGSLALLGLGGLACGTRRRRH